MLREAVLQFQEAWSEKGLQLDIGLDEVAYTGNEELLWDVWHNLVGNAIKFTQPGGHMGVVLQARPSGGAEVRVSDDGPGMSAEAQGHIFEKFYQADPSHATEGSGLGLVLARRIVDLHGGSIVVTSALGVGSTFTVRLP